MGDQFSGDLSRNEVEMDLSKFLEIMKDNSDLKDKIRELQGAEKVNPYQKWIHLAKTIDAWRIFPRVFVGVYIYLLYAVVIWFMTLNEPNLEQAGLVSVVVGAMAAVFGIYAGTSGQSKKFKGEG
jgi:hypothetical protein|tara:strand:+ start:186 stop:560 length:375 start_codon:yes stop_codon:yes gene_type:complete